MGSPHFASEILSALLVAGYPILGVITQPDKPAGRGRHVTPCASAQLARNKNLPLFQPASLREPSTQKQVAGLRPDFIVVAAYGKWIPSEFMRGAIIDTVNVHPSLLPKYRGAAPIQWALINGETETGVTLMRPIAAMDAGPVFVQKKVAIADDDNELTLSRRLTRLGGELLAEMLPKIVSGNINPTPQDESGVKAAPLLKKGDGRVNWQSPAPSIRNLIRGIIEWPRAFTSFDKKRVTLYDSDALPEKPIDTAGTVWLVSPRGVHVTCGAGSLCLKEVQMEGKKRMSGADFAHGVRMKEGMRFE